MPVMTWKRMAALALLGAGVLVVLAGALLSSTLLLTGGALAVAGAIGLVAVATYRRAGFAIRMTADQHDRVLALLGAIDRLDARVQGIDRALRQTVGRDLQSLVLNAFRDVDGRVEELARSMEQGSAVADEHKSQVNAQLSSIHGALRAGGEMLDRQGGGISVLAQRVDSVAGAVDEFADRLRAISELQEVISGLADRIERLEGSTTNSLQQAHLELQTEVGSVAKQVRSLAHEIGLGRLRSDVLNDAASLQYIQQRLPLESASPPLLTGWSLEPASLANLLRLVIERRPALIVECGSGASTVWLARAAREYGGRVVALEHQEEYARAVRDDLVRHKLEHIADVRLAPLESFELDGEQYRWYARDAWVDLDGIELLLVDGPPKATGLRARYPAVPLLGAQLAAGALLVLDDVHREVERDVLSAWQVESGSLSAHWSIGPRTAAMEWQQASAP